MSGAAIAAIGLAVLLAATNGLHDAANSIATLVGTRAARPATAVLIAAIGNLAGPLLMGAAVADTVGGMVHLPPGSTVRVVGAALTGAVVWNVVTWSRGLPASSGHAVVGGLLGASIAEAGTGAVEWGGFNGVRPVGVIGVVVVLLLAPIAGFAAGFVLDRSMRGATHRATARMRGPVRGAQWFMAGSTSFAHGANDAQKAVGLATLILLAEGKVSHFAAPTWITIACSVALTAGTAMGGWPIVRTIGQRIVRLRPVDSLASQTASTAVLFGSSVLGAPVSTTHIVASSVVGVGAGHHRWRHVDWVIVRTMLAGWVVTLPVVAALSALALVAWGWWT